VALRILRLQKRQSAGDFFGFFGALKRTQKKSGHPKKRHFGSWRLAEEKKFQFRKKSSQRIS
jgi:hypothetical protein